MTAVIYARHSPGPAQTECSIEGQLQDCYAYAKRNNITVVGEYIDRARSGTNDQRPDFQRMIKDSGKKLFDTILVYKIDRFARNRYDSAMYKYKIKKNGVRILSVMENIADGPEGIILESLLEGMAEYYSANLSQNVKRGQRVANQNGTFTGSTPPIGYKVVDKRVEIDDSTAPLIRKAFQKYASGEPKKTVYEWLVSSGIKTSRGGLSYGCFHNALKKPKYIGENYYNGEIVPNTYPAIIDRDIFDAVQRRIEKARRAPATGKAKINYWLQGKAFCGYCGASMVGDSGTGRGGVKYHYYSCAAKKKLHTCKKRTEKKDWLEWYVVEQTLLYVLTPERMEYIAERVVEQYKKEFGGNQIASLERQIKKLDRQLEQCVDLMLETGSKAARKKLELKADELAAQKDDLEVELAKMRIASKISLTEEEVIVWMKAFCGGDIMDDDFRCRIIDTFINSIYVYDDKIVIYYNVKDSEQISYIDMCDDLENLDNGEVRISNGLPSQSKKRHSDRNASFLYCQSVSPQC